MTVTPVFTDFEFPRQVEVQARKLRRGSGCGTYRPSLLIFEAIKGTAAAPADPRRK